jgi:hypothetical protein
MTQVNCVDLNSSHRQCAWCDIPFVNCYHATARLRSFLINISTQIQQVHFLKTESKQLGFLLSSLKFLAAESLWPSLSFPILRLSILALCTAKSRLCALWSLPLVDVSMLKLLIRFA